MKNISIKIQDNDIQKMLAEIAGRMKDMRPVTAMIGEIVMESIQTNFEVGGRPAWRQLSPVTIAQRERMKKWPGQILVRSGVRGGLMGSISYEPERDRVVIGTNKIYATTMHFGAKRGEFGSKSVKIGQHERRGKGDKRHTVQAHTRMVSLPWGDIPARPFLVIQNKDWDKIKRSLGNYVVGGKP